MAIDFTRLARAEVNRRILQMLQDPREHEHRMEAIQAVNQFNALQTAKLTEDQFDTAVLSVVAKLDVPMPSVPADLDSLTDTQARTLAAAMELAEWDYYKRAACLSQNLIYWRQAGSPPTASQYLGMWLRMMNYVRAKRGLAAVA